MKFKRRGKHVRALASVSMMGSRGYSALFLGLGVLIFLVSMVNQGALSSVRTATTDIFTPVMDAVNKPLAEAAYLVRDISGLATIQEENARLRTENEKLQAWYQKAMTLEAENASLQELLNVKMPENAQFATARVAADSGSSFMNSVLITAGTKDGIEKGHVVVSKGGLIGRVIESGNNAARVLLITDINSRIPVLITGSNQRALMAGQNDPNPTLMHLPDNLQVEEGARVITSGHGGLFPYGLAIGSIYKDESGAYRVIPSSDIDQTHFVSIINANSSDNDLQGLRNF